MEGLHENGSSDTQSDKHESIAIIGFSLKFPQDATSSESFWDMLMQKRSACTEFPEDRLNVEAFYHADPKRPDTLPYRGGHFLQEPLGLFDAPFFSITQSEASSMDPQHRGLLETSFRAFENAGLSLKDVYDSRTSVHTGCFTDDYKLTVLKDPDTLPLHAATGLSVSILANRLSWFFGLTGPSVNLDSACSSSMMALDFACQGLWRGDTNMALVAGCNLLISPDNALTLSNMNFISKDSRSFSFDDRGNGYGRGEGFGVVILKRVSDAIRDKDTIRAVIRSTGSNQDGRTPGITQPSQIAQENLIKETYAKAGLEMKDTRFFEAHGTGTAIGDPTEASAIGRTLGKSRSADDPLYVGAVKSNIGHLEGGSGLASIIKTVLVLEKGIIPPNANFERLNPRIDAKSSNLKFPLAPTPWPHDGLRRASINSFGFGGSNSHAVLDDAYNFLKLRNLDGNHSTTPQPIYTNGTVQNGTLQNGHTVPHGETIPKLLVWSSSDEGGLKRQEKVYREHFSRKSSLATKKVSTYLKDLAYTLATRRSALNWKSYSFASSMSDLADIHLSKPIRSNAKFALGFIFTGQGAQYANMGIDLLEFSVFRQSVDKSGSYLREFGCQWSIIDELSKDKTSSRISSPELSQPLCSVLQIALIDLLKSFKILPSIAVGHSSGEIAAAYSVGGLSHKSACKVAFFRGYHASALVGRSNNSTMMSVGLSQAEVRDYLTKFASGVSIACVNSPGNVTLSGDETEILALKSVLDEQNIFARKLQVNIAYHSPQMELIAAEYRSSLSDLEPGEKSNAIMISSVTGKQVSRDELTDADYWVKNMTQPVEFLSAVIEISSKSGKGTKRRLGDKSRSIPQIHHLLEIGPHSGLAGPIRDILKAVGKAGEISYSSALIRGQSDIKQVLEVTGHLYCSGYSIDLLAVNSSCGDSTNHRYKTLTDLPEYQFDHSQNYWHEDRFSKSSYRLRKYPRLDLLGIRVPDWNPLEARWRKFMRVSETPWIVDHKVNGSILYPAAGMLVMAIEGAHQLMEGESKITGYTIKDATFNRPIIVSLEGRGIESQLYMRPLSDSSESDATNFEFRVCVYENEQWVENCRGMIKVELEEGNTQFDAGNERKEITLHLQQVFKEGTESCRHEIDTKRMYEYLNLCGLEYGPAFQALDEMKCSSEGEAYGKARIFRWTAHENSNHAQAHIIHPTTFDGIVQMMLVALTNGGQKEIPTVIPTRINHAWISSSGLNDSSASYVRVHSKAEFTGLRTAESSMFVLDERSEKLLLSIEAEGTTVTTLSQEPKEKKLCYNMKWLPALDMLQPQKVQEICASMRPTDPEEPIKFYRDIELLLRMFISKSLDELKESGADITKPHIARYIGWMKHQVDRYHDIPLPNSQPGVSEFLQDQEDLCERVLSSGVQGKFFLEIGQNLTDILTGKTDPLSLLSQNNLSQSYYNELSTKVMCFEPLEKYLQLLSHKSPRLRVIEIGAGAGATTGSILNALSTYESGELSASGVEKYDYTDVDPNFFDAAKETFAKHKARMDFQSLDIERDPAQQGFVPGNYDLVIASNVIHLTRNLDKTMRNVRSLLKPGGKLVLYEPTADVTRIGFTCGLLPEWWLAEEKSRSWRPYLSTQEWNMLLDRTGFSNTELEIPDYLDETCHGYSILVSTAIKTPPSLLPFKSTVLVVQKDSPFQLGLAQDLELQLSSKQDISSGIITIEDLGSVGELQEKFCIFMAELEHPVLSNLDANLFQIVQKTLSTAYGTLWVSGGAGESRDPAFALIEGLSRVIRTEFGGAVFVTLALDPKTQFVQSQSQNIFEVFRQTITATDNYEPEYFQKDGNLEIGRLFQSSLLNREVFMKTRPQERKFQEFGAAPPLVLAVASPGSLDSLQFVADLQYNKPLAPGEIEIETHAIGINFRDCLIALGQLAFKSMGAECSGIISKVGEGCTLKVGDRVCTSALDAFQTFMRTDERCAIKIPDTMTFSQGASLSVVFVTAHYSLLEIARLQPSESVLIHAGAGGTGQAAIQVAKFVGAEIFVTVGSAEKRQFLIDQYQIPEDHIFYSRNTSFAQGVMRMTSGRGVDVILNSLSGKHLTASWECIAPFGRFVEIGKRDIYAHAKLPMFNFGNNVSFSAIDLAAITKQRPAIIQKSLQWVMNLFEKGSLKLIEPITTWPISDVEGAFRYIQGGKNMGKAIVEINKSDRVLTALDTVPKYQFDDNATYLIAGGLGGLGRSIVTWMVSRGAKNFILLSRSGPRTDAAKTMLGKWKSKGINVETPACDIADLESLRSVIKRCTKTMPPIKGCIQGTMVLKDAIFQNMTFDQWSGSLSPKVQGSWNLHNLLPQGMDFFIMLSSISGIVGLGGQANYAAGNTFKDALAHHRLTKGEKAISLDLGWMDAEGAVNDSDFLKKGFLAAGCYIPISAEEMIALLDYYCDPALEATRTTCQAIIGLDTPDNIHFKGFTEPSWMNRPTFQTFHQYGYHRSSLENSSEGTVNYEKAIRMAGSLTEAREIVTEALVLKLSKALMIPKEDIDNAKPLHSYGVDSLLAVELRNWFSTSFQADIAVFDLMNRSDLVQIGMVVAGRSQYCPKSWSNDEGEKE